MKLNLTFDVSIISPEKFTDEILSRPLQGARSFRWTTWNETGKLFWDLTGNSPAGNYIREASSGNWPNARVSKTNPYKQIVP